MKRKRFENPAQKGRRYARELKAKKKSNGTSLTASTAGFRMGYLFSRSDNAAAYNAKQGLKSKKKYKIEKLKPLSDAEYEAFKKKRAGRQKAFNAALKEFDSALTKAGVKIDKRGEPYVTRPNGRRDYDPQSVIMADQRRTLRDIGEYDIDGDLPF